MTALSLHLAELRKMGALSDANFHLARPAFCRAVTALQHVADLGEGWRGLEAVPDPGGKVLEVLAAGLTEGSEEER